MTMIGPAPTKKERRNYTIDADVASWVDASPNASATVNAALRASMEAAREREALRALVDELETDIGQPDHADLDYFTALFGGRA